MKSNNQTFASVWDAISASPQEAANMKAKSLLLMALQRWLEKFEGTQKNAAALLGISQPRLSDLKRGHIDLFSLDTLLNMAELAGLSPTVQVKIPRAKRVTTVVAVVAPTGARKAMGTATRTIRTTQKAMQ